jgi:hypothetical protein
MFGLGYPPLTKIWDIGVVISDGKLLHTWRVRSRGCGVERVVPEARLNLLAKELGFVQIRHQMTEL